MKKFVTKEQLLAFATKLDIAMANKWKFDLIGSVSDEAVTAGELESNDAILDANPAFYYKLNGNVNNEIDTDFWSSSDNEGLIYVDDGGRQVAKITRNIVHLYIKATNNQTYNPDSYTVMFRAKKLALPDGRIYFDVVTQDEAKELITDFSPSSVWFGTGLENNEASPTNLDKWNTYFMVYKKEVTSGNDTGTAYLYENGSQIGTIATKVNNDPLGIEDVLLWIDDYSDDDAVIDFRVKDLALFGRALTQDEMNAISNEG